ncbi:TRAP transporter large permease [Sagittula stellata]|uniref:TRAP transporter large permease protein n=1 Tax=Sagittula stellata (strain ATCC 700073 / DSM 11524 / E-37) TaxID=388399 RepID=A3K4G6_SAGS3|nr:TRAP transporter large permease subunit [Sagittula stellata]EBA07865.1 DctM (C4-dicarboxylate permease, large subunit) [Sagittula stellata E-37]
MAETLIYGLSVFSVIVALLAGGLWVAPALIAGGCLALYALTGVPVGSLLASSIWDASHHWPLTALPLFVWMGEILFRSRLSSDLYQGLAPMLGRLPGGLLHVNVVGCGVMASITGSSAVTAATIGRMSLPELDRQGYDQRLAIGSLAGSGTLGLLIPPSIMMIVYGVLTQQSIARLFIAGLLPGLMLMLLFAGYIAARAILSPEAAPRLPERISLWAKLWTMRRLGPVFALMGLVIGAIYGGVATPTEAATLGVLGALAISAAYRTLNWHSFRDALGAAVRTSCMITFILCSAAFLSVALGFAGVPSALSGAIAGWDLSPYALLLVLTGLYLFLGCFLEGASMMVLTLPIVQPLVEAAGFDMIWFGIFLIICIEMAQITPPVGMNLFVLQGMTGRSLPLIFRSSLPFFVLMLVALILISLVPGIVLWPVGGLT